MKDAGRTRGRVVDRIREGLRRPRAAHVTALAVPPPGRGFVAHRWVTASGALVSVLALLTLTVGVSFGVAVLLLLTLAAGCMRIAYGRAKAATRWGNTVDPAARIGTIVMLSGRGR